MDTSSEQGTRSTALDAGRPTTRRWHSMSSTREYEDCPRRYRFGYLDKRPKDRPAPVSWRFASAVHAGLEAAYRRLLEDADGGIVGQLAASRAAIDDCWQRLGLDEDSDHKGRARAAWLVGRALAQDVLRIRRILDVEAPLRDTICEDERIVGFADLVLERDEGVVEIVDHKVTRHRASPQQLREDFQLNLYGQLARLRWPWATTIRVTHHYPIGPAAVTATLDHDTMATARERVHQAAATIRQDTEFLPVPGPRCGHCPWQPSCPEGRDHVDATDPVAQGSATRSRDSSTGMRRRSTRSTAAPTPLRDGL